ncbi:hypothetical protein TWF718_006483 [Orbilia javanica]|uniref:Uncharacterized protein n=1 Tax=Orbilia javanica TaxID=47235 RepID=A0AAN8NYH8_9PEZI
MTDGNYNPPAEEPAGYEALPGSVKSRWENNEYYIEGFSDHPWYPIIKRTHEAIKKLVPNYNISQIKSKFGGLRYYVNLPRVIEPKEGHTTEEIKDRIDNLILYARAWVDGFEHARKAQGKQGKE